MTTGLIHGPLAGQDLTKLTGLSVLQGRHGFLFFVRRGPHSVWRFYLHRHDVPDDVTRWSEEEVRSLTYLGEWSDDTRTVILAPEGGWRADPIPNVEVADFMMSDGRWYERQRKPRFWHLVAAIRLIKDAKLEGMTDPVYTDGAPVPDDMRIFTSTPDRRAQALSDLAEMDGGLIGDRPAYPMVQILRWIAEGYVIIEGDGERFTMQSPDDEGPQEVLVDVREYERATPASPPAETGDGEPVEQRAYDLLVAEVEGFDALSAGKKSDIHRVLVAALSATPPVPAVAGEPVAWLYTENRWKDGPRHRLSLKRQAISDEDANEFEITEDALYKGRPAPSADQSGVIGARSGFYVASRASLSERPAMWRALRDQGVKVNSTWIDEAGEGETACNRELWSRIEREVKASARLILYVEPGDFPMKGALVEIGMAIAAEIPVSVVAPGVVMDARTLRPLGSWAMHPLVSFHDTVAETLAAHAAGGKS